MVTTFFSLVTNEDWLNFPLVQPSLVKTMVMLITGTTGCKVKNNYNYNDRQMNVDLLIF